MNELTVIKDLSFKWSAPDGRNSVRGVPRYMSEVNKEMSPTVFRDKGYRFFFFSREETRMHVHVHCADGEAKFWLDPVLELARAHGVSQKQLREMKTLIEEHRDDITDAWHEHFRH